MKPAEVKIYSHKLRWLFDFDKVQVERDAIKIEDTKILRIQGGYKMGTFFDSVTLDETSTISFKYDCATTTKKFGIKVDDKYYSEVLGSWGFAHVSSTKVHTFSTVDNKNFAFSYKKLECGMMTFFHSRGVALLDVIFDFGRGVLEYKVGETKYKRDLEIYFHNI